MSGGNKQRNKKQRIENLGIQKPRFVQWWQSADKVQWGSRIGIAAIAALGLMLLCQTWHPPFAYRENALSARDLVTRVTFKVPDEKATDELRKQKLRDEPAYYRNRTVPLDQLRAFLKDKLFLILSTESFDQLDDAARKSLAQFTPGGEDDNPLTLEERFEKLKAVFADDPELKKLEQAIRTGMEENYKYGVFVGMQHTAEQGSQQVIRIYQEGLPDDVQYVEVKDARIAEAGPKLTGMVKDRFREVFSEEEDAQTVARMIGGWLVAKLPEFETLKFDRELTEKKNLETAAAIEPVMTIYQGGESVLARAGDALTPAEVGLLRREWESLVDRMNWSDRLFRMVAYFGMIVALYLLCGSYIYFVDDRTLVLDQWQLAKLLAVMVGTISGGYWLAEYRCEMIAITIGSIVASVVYKRELSLLLMAAGCVSLTLFLGNDVAELVAISSVATCIVLLLGRIRTRTHLLWVGAITAIVTMMTVIGVGVVTGQTLSAGAIGSDLESVYRGPVFDRMLAKLFTEAGFRGFLIMASAAAMTAILPLVEKGFGVQTDLSLLELGDASHPLLRRLAQRAPGTYNHSINVASIAEAAADSIGANGLLVRVGAYFHDIGKMFKPEYFIENQSTGVNQHDTLQPAMSTLVIIAHVKDGADLARSHSLPQPIIDLIMQHHGTTLVEYFYREAARRSEEDPNGESVSDKDFRYPGPKPQTLEAAVMMLADTVESASRTLVDPTPARIKNLVDAIAEKKMGDGQFDDCGMTFKQLYRVRASLVKSLTAIYHARVKYPGQQSA